MARFTELPAFVLTIVIVAVAAGIGATILYKTKTEVGSASATVNTTLDDGVSAMGDITSWLGVVVIVMMGGIIIKLLVEAFQ